MEFSTDKWSKLQEYSTMTSRNRKPSLSSILKTQSPSRTALLDLNPNLNGPPSDETTHLDVQAEKKKKRRSSRRVSFAETYQVKEFMKDSDRKELGLWDDSQDGTTHQELPDFQQASNPSDTAGPRDGCLDPAHHITGLETLLSGPIKQEAHSMTSACQEPYMYATSHINVQSTSSAESLHQHTQDSNPDQRKNDVHETSVKSSFLKSFIAADSCGNKGSFTTDLNAFAAPPSTSQSYLPPPRQQQEQGTQEDPPQESSFRSSFLQAFVAAGPSSSGSEAPGSLKPNTEQSADPGMELTNCFHSSEVPNRCEAKEENIGDITRIFGGQGDGFENENGMDMTTCIGGFDTLHKKLDRPAAESTRILNSENTENMDFTACLGGMSTRRSMERTLNQTGTNMNFTQVFGKISESDYAVLPHESTARLLQRIDAAIAGSNGSGAETSSYIDSSKTGNVNILHQTRDNTRKSIALDPIQEVSSSTASMLNVTSGDRSAVSAPTPLDACAEEDEMDITTCSNYTRDVRSRPVQQELSRVPDNEDTGAMEMTCAIGNSVPAVGPFKVVSSSIQGKGSYGDHTRIYDSAADDSAEMEMTCAINQPLVTASQAKGGLSRFPAALDEDKTRVFNFEDTAAMEMTCVMDGANSSAFSVQNVHRGNMMSSSSIRLPSSEKENAPSDPSRTMSSSFHAKESRADHTRVFDSAADDSAEMEMTCAINQPLVTDSRAKEVPSAASTSTFNEDKTRVFDSEDTAAMEMTCVIGGSNSSALSVQNMSSSGKGIGIAGPSKGVPPYINEKESREDHPRVFNDSAEMEMTCAISQPLITGVGSQAKGGLSRFPAALDEDKTRVFNFEDTAAMEMTCVMDGANSSAFSVQNVHRGNMMSSSSIRLPSSEKENAPSDPSRTMSSSFHAKESRADHTRVFDSAADDSAEMEMTCAINQPLVTDSRAKEVPSAASTSTFNEDKTRVFDSEDTAAMEMTCVIGGSNSSALSVQNMSSSGKGIGIAGPSKGVPPYINEKESREDHPRVFNDSAEMEMTCAISQPLITGVGSQTKGGHSRLSAAFDEDKTKVFTSDDTAAMEMTCAMNEPFIAGSQTKGGLSVLPTAFQEDRTRVFNSEDTAAMEMTCVMSAANSSAFSVQNVHQGKMMSSSQKENTLLGFSHLVHNGSSKRADDTTHFESTECFGDLPEGLAYQMRRKREQQGADNLQSDDTAHMEMTECVGVAPSNSISEQSSHHKISKNNTGKVINEENTCYFTPDNGDNMQMTECLDKQPVRQLDHEQTKHFQAEDTGNMEMTTCVGSLQTVPTMKTNARVCADEQTHIFNNEDHTANLEMTEAFKKSLEELKHIPQSEDTASMEMTACVGSFPSLSSTLNVSEHAGEPLTSDFVGKTLPNFSTSDDTTKKSHAQSDISAVTFPRMASNMEHPVKSEDDPMRQQRPRVQEERTKQRNGEINVSGDILHDKTSDTYTLSNPPIELEEDHQLGADLAMQEKFLEGRNSDTFTINASAMAGSGKRKLSSLTEGNTTRNTSHSSDEGQTKADGEGSSSSPDMESQVLFALKDSIVLPDWIDADDEKGILEELPIDNDNTEDLCLTSTKRPRMDESCFTSSHMDASYLTSNLSHLPMSSSESGASSVADFLQTFFQFNDQPLGKRSIMCPTKINEPTTLGSHLENACLVKPKADMYEWAIKFLTPTVEELRKAVRSQETKHLEESAPIIKEMQSAGPERCAEILKKGKSLQKYCTASSKSKMKEWRLQMVKNTKAAMEDSHQHLENKVTKLTSSLSTIEEQLQQLASVDSVLDDAISSLEQIKLPTEEEKSEWRATSERLVSFQTKLQEEEKTVQETDSERQRLEAEIKSLEESRTKLEAEQEELSSRLGTGSRQADQELDNMKSEIILLHSFQEWRLQAFHENNYKFSFLNKSVRLSMQYGDTESGAKLNDLSLHSVLADDACCSAKLAHSLFFSSICADKLKTLYPTLVGLPQMMQHLSELAGQVRLLEAEVSRVDFWHPVTTTQNRLSIEFSSIEAHSMFRIHLDIVPGQYPFATIPHSCTIKIGKISEESVNATMDAVQPGWQYISRITKAIEQLISKHSS